MHISRDISQKQHLYMERTAATLIASFMGSTWGPSGADRTQVDPMLAPWTLPSGYLAIRKKKTCDTIRIASICHLVRSMGARMLMLTDWFTKHDPVQSCNIVTTWRTCICYSILHKYRCSDHNVAFRHTLHPYWIHGLCSGEVSSTKIMQCVFSLTDWKHFAIMM